MLLYICTEKVLQTKNIILYDEVVGDKNLYQRMLEQQ